MIPLYVKLVNAPEEVEHTRRIAIPSPITGKITSLDGVPDPLFSQRLFGEGIAIAPTGYQVLAPVDGVVNRLPTMGNQLQMRSKQGVQLNIQLGVQSESMMGAGFTCLVKAGDQVKAGQRLIEFDIIRFKQQLASPLCMFTMMNSDKVRGIVAHTGSVVAGEDTAMTLLI